VNIIRCSRIVQLRKMDWRIDLQHIDVSVSIWFGHFGDTETDLSLLHSICCAAFYTVSPGANFRISKIGHIEIVA
jgi:hypothetical protein